MTTGGASLQLHQLQRQHQHSPDRPRYQQNIWTPSPRPVGLTVGGELLSVLEQTGHTDQIALNQKRSASANLADGPFSELHETGL